MLIIGVLRNLFSAEDYANENKKTRPGNARVSKKTKLPTEAKTKVHDCSQCERTDASKYPISENEVRWLCPICVQKALNKNKKEKVNFVRASQLGSNV